MGQIAFEIQRARHDIVVASAKIATALKDIQEQQASCSHCWRFNRQVNAYHVEEWHVTYKCCECDSEKTERKKPVCETCDLPLVRAKPGDTKAERERKKKKYRGHMNPPIAFRCPKCRTIHILWHEGD